MVSVTRCEARRGRCSIRGQHTDQCTSDRCRGCVPSPATHGRLCQWHRNRLVWAVADHAGFVGHLREIGRPYAQATPLRDLVTTGGDPAERPALPAAWTAADELDTDLTSWTRALLDEPIGRVSWPNRPPWRGDIPRWLLDHETALLEAPFVGEIIDTWLRDVRTAHAAHPTAADIEPAHKIAGFVCPRCDLASLVYTPPRFAGQPFVVECTDPACARVFSEDEWDRFVAIVTMRIGKRGQIA